MNFQFQFQFQMCTERRNGNGGTECFGSVGVFLTIPLPLPYRYHSTIPPLYHYRHLQFQFQFQFQHHLHFHFPSSLLSTTPFKPSAPIFGPINVMSCEFVALQNWFELVDLREREGVTAPNRREVVHTLYIYDAAAIGPYTHRQTTGGRGQGTGGTAGLQYSTCMRLKLCVQSNFGHVD